MSTNNHNENVYSIYQYSKKFSYGFTLFRPYYKNPEVTDRYNCADVNTGLPRSQSWSKILSLIKLYERDDKDEEIYYVFINENIFLNKEVSLEEYIENNKDSDLVFYIKGFKPYSDFIIAKRSKETLDFLKEWYSLPTKHNEGPVAENSTLEQMIEKKENLVFSFIFQHNPLFLDKIVASDEKLDPFHIVSYDTSKIVGPFKKISVLFGTPCFGAQISCNFTTSLIKTFDLLRKFDIHHDVCFIPNQIVTRARNLIADSFLETDFTHLFFIDADIHWDPTDVIRLLNHQEHITVGLYANKGYNFDEDNFNMDSLYKTLNYSSVFNEKMVTDDISENLLITVKYGATGFMSIKREVFDKIKKNTQFYMNVDKKIIRDYFPCCVLDNEYLTEDYYFCKLWKDVGGEIYADLNIILRHEGWHSYPSNPLKSMKMS